MRLCFTGLCLLEITIIESMSETSTDFNNFEIKSMFLTLKPFNSHTVNEAGVFLFYLEKFLKNENRTPVNQMSCALFYR